MIPEAVLPVPDAVNIPVEKPKVKKEIPEADIRAKAKVQEPGPELKPGNKKEKVKTGDLDVEEVKTPPSAKTLKQKTVKEALKPDKKQADEKNPEDPFQMELPL